MTQLYQWNSLLVFALITPLGGFKDIFTFKIHLKATPFSIDTNGGQGVLGRKETTQ